MAAVLGLVDAALRELLLFAAVGVLLGGIDDLAVDLIYWGRLGWRRIARRGPATPPLGDFPPVDPPAGLRCSSPPGTRQG